MPKEWIAFALIGSFILLFLVIFLVGYLISRKRQAGLKSLAEELGFTFAEKAPLSYLADIPPFWLFSQGRQHRLNNIIEGKTETVDVRIFDFRYMTSSGKNTNHHAVTVVAIGSPELNLPEMRGRPETMLDWIGLTFDGKDIDFESRPGFSKAYHLHGADEAAIRALFNDELFDFFEGQKSAYFESKGKWFLFCHFERTLPVTKIRELFKSGFSLYLLFKDAQQI